MVRALAVVHHTTVVTYARRRHEHLYEKLEHNVIRSDKLQKNIVAVEQQLGGARVILCTLSMLSNPRISHVIHLVPVQLVSPSIEAFMRVNRRHELTGHPRRS